MPSSTMASSSSSSYANNSSSPSKIPVPRTVRLGGSSPEEQSSSGGSAPALVSRIPKAVAVASPVSASSISIPTTPDRRTLVAEEDGSGWSKKSSSSSSAHASSPSSDAATTFVRRISPPFASSKPCRNDSADERAWTQQQPIEKHQYQQTRRSSDSSLNKCGGPSMQQQSPRKSSTAASAAAASIVSATSACGSPSKIPIATDYATATITTKSRSSSCSAESAGSSTPRTSPVRQVSPQRKLTTPSSAAARERTFSKSSSVEQLESSRRLAPSPDRGSPEKDHAAKETALHLDLSGSRIPLPRGRQLQQQGLSPQQAMPTVGWSFSPERMLGDQTARSISLSASNLQSRQHGENGSDAAKAKKFEAFMMTGDRMIKLAKTPANLDFKLRRDKSATVGEDAVNEDGGFKSVKPSSRRALVRNSKSEDQLDGENLESPSDDCSGSVDTLMDSSGIGYLETGAALDQRSSSKVNPMMEPPSPEVDTSSLMSCSEHYNAQSLLDNKLLSPNDASSSPETPEWSLMDSFHKTNVGSTKSPSTPTDPTVLSSPPILQQQISASSSSSNGGTVCHDRDIVVVSPPSPQQSTLTTSSEEDSDLDSLRSYCYHPPVKVVDVPSAVRLAKRLFHMDGFKKTDVARHLSKNTEYNHVVAEEYLRYFDFSSISLDQALRRFLGHFCLTGETQERERVLLHFSKRFLECNPDVLGRLFNSQDAVHTLTCAIMLLNTDLHGENLSRKMSCVEFIENLSDLNEGTNFPPDLLKNIYAAIKMEPIPWALSPAPGEAPPTAGNLREVQELALLPTQMQLLPHRLDAEAQGPMGARVAATVSFGQTAGGINPFLSLPDSSQSVDFKNGYVMRKACFDANGKRTKIGKRSWKMFFLTLRDMVLYCFKDEKTVRSPGAFEDLNSAIRIHHGLAVRAVDYSKKQFVFRLYTCDQAQYLFQTSDEKELLTWIDAINYVVASFSSPQLPAPVSSGTRFQRPLMPSSKTRLTPEDQLAAHENQLYQLRSEIEHHLQHPPSRGNGGSSSSSSKLVASSTVYKEKTENLKFEIMRYETYVITLRTKNSRD